MSRKDSKAAKKNVAWAGWGLLAFAVSCGFTAQAHEIGTTRVTVDLRSAGEYRIEIVTDAAALAEKLGGHPKVFPRRVQVAFDGVEVTPVIQFHEGSPMAMVHLSGAIPAGARQFTWKYGWTFASYALTIEGPSGKPATEWLEGGQASAPFVLSSPATRVTRMDIAWRYLRLGFTHILPLGLDHMLFVLGIYLLSRRARSVLCQISAFTVAHSITLGLSMYGLVTVSPRIVEPRIAVSIAYVAIENIFLSELKLWRVALVFGFGLLHGMGFAGALQELGLPRSEFATALLTFNIGVEAGQLSVIAAAFLLVGWHCSHRDWYRSRVVVPASAMIACTAVYWTVQRLAIIG
jgi:hydrogenase/urease accessory protein HupE